MAVFLHIKKKKQKKNTDSSKERVFQGDAHYLDKLITLKFSSIAYLSFVIHWILY